MPCLLIWRFLFVFFFLIERKTWCLSAILKKNEYICFLYPPFCSRAWTAGASLKSLGWRRRNYFFQVSKFSFGSFHSSKANPTHLGTFSNKISAHLFKYSSPFYACRSALMWHARSSVKSVKNEVAWSEASSACAMPTSLWLTWTPASTRLRRVSIWAGRCPEIQTSRGF